MIEILQALLTPVIAIATTCIAYQQYRIRRDEKSLAMYDRRLSLFKAAISIVDRIRAGDTLVTDDAFSWASSVAEAEFLFGPEVQAVLDPLFEAVYEYAILTEPTTLGGQPYNTACAAAANQVEFFRQPLLAVLAPYLRPAGSASRRKRRLSVKEAEALLPEPLPESELPATGTPDSDEIPF